MDNSIQGDSSVLQMDIMEGDISGRVPKIWCSIDKYIFLCVNVRYSMVDDSAGDLIL